MTFQARWVVTGAAMGVLIGLLVPAAVITASEIFGEGIESPDEEFVAKTVIMGLLFGLVFGAPVGAGVGAAAGIVLAIVMPRDIARTAPRLTAFLLTLATGGVIALVVLLFPGGKAPSADVWQVWLLSVALGAAGAALQVPRMAAFARKASPPGRSTEPSP